MVPSTSKTPRPKPRRRPPATTATPTSAIRERRRSTRIPTLTPATLGPSTVHVFDVSLDGVGFRSQSPFPLFSTHPIVIGTGLINFNIYSSLKTWIDNVARAGLTFKYTESGPVGLATGKKVYVVLASGGVYSQGPAAPLNHAVPYLKSVLGFMGITDIETIYVEGLAFGPEAAEKAIGAAKSRVEEIALAA